MAEAAPIFDPALKPWMTEFARQLFDATDFHRWAGLRLLRLEPGLCVAEFRAAQPVTVQDDGAGGGYVHGGIVNGLLEPAAFAALIPLLAEDETAMTIDFHAQHMRGLPSGARVEVVGRVERRARALAFCQSETRIDGRTHTLARITKTILPKPAAVATARIGS